MFLFCLVIQLMCTTIQLQSQSIVLLSSDKSTVKVPAQLIDSSPVLGNLLDGNDQEVTIKLPSKQVVVEQFLALASTKITPSKGSFKLFFIHLFRDLLFFMNVFYGNTTSDTSSKTGRPSTPDQILGEQVEKKINSMHKSLSPSFSKAEIIRNIQNDLSEHIVLADLLGLNDVKGKLINAFAGTLLYKSHSAHPFILPFIRESNLSEKCKIELIQRLGNYYLSTTALKKFLRMIVEQDLSSSQIRREIGEFDDATLHHLLFVLESYFEPKDLQDLRNEPAASVQLQVKRVQKISLLEDPIVQKIRTCLIRGLADRLTPSVENSTLMNLLVFSSLCHNTVVDIMRVFIEKHPGLLREFVAINRINNHRTRQNMPHLLTFSESTVSEPFKRILGAIAQKYAYFRPDPLYTSLKISLDSAY